MKHQTAIAFTLIAALLLCNGCKLTSKTKTDDAASYQGVWEPVNLIEVNYEAADKLAAQLESWRETDTPALVASFVSLDDLAVTGRFGRLCSEQFASRLAQQGILAIDMRKRSNALIIEREGEFLLSRDLDKLADQHDVRAIVAGVYSETDTEVYITVRALSASDGDIIASVDYVIPLDAGVSRLLGHNKRQWSR